MVMQIQRHLLLMAHLKKHGEKIVLQLFLMHSMEMLTQQMH